MCFGCCVPGDVCGVTVLEMKNEVKMGLSSNGKTFDLQSKNLGSNPGSST